MNLHHARVALRERSLVDVLDLAIRFCVTHAGAYARMSLVMIAPAFATTWSVAQAHGWWVAWPLAVLLASLIDGCFVALASRLVFGHARVRDALRATATVLHHLVAVRLVQGIALLASLSLLGMPWLWLGAVLLFMPEVVVLERATLLEVWVRSFVVAHSGLGIAASARFLLSGLVGASVLFADMAGRELQGILEIRPDPSILEKGGSTLALLGFWAVLPLVATTRFFVYLDVRTRAEGWDIQTRFAALVARTDSP